MPRLDLPWPGDAAHDARFVIHLSILSICHISFKETCPNASSRKQIGRGRESTGPGFCYSLILGGGGEKRLRHPCPAFIRLSISSNQQSHLLTRRLRVPRPRLFSSLSKLMYPWIELRAWLVPAADMQKNGARRYRPCSGWTGEPIAIGSRWFRRHVVGSN